MGKESGALRRVREQIANSAARMIAEDGIQDYALAKRKAARLLGVSDKLMPNNAEVEEALRAYHAIYQQDEQSERLYKLRGLAVQVMQMLAPFNPYLTGSVLTGLAARHSDINLQLFTDSAKDVEIFLINHQWPYDTREKRYVIQDQARMVPVFILYRDDTAIELAVFDTDDLRHMPRARTDGTPIERARATQVEQLMGG